MRVLLLYGTKISDSRMLPITFIHPSIGSGLNQAPVMTSPDPLLRVCQWTFQAVSFSPLVGNSWTISLTGFSGGSPFGSPLNRPPATRASEVSDAPVRTTSDKRTKDIFHLGE